MKYIKRVIVFTLVFLVILTVLSSIFVPKNNSKESGMDQISANGILGEKENVIDVLVVGDSESYTSISPMEIYDQYGITAYVCGTPAQRLFDTYNFYKVASERQQIKTLIIETNAIFRKNTLWLNIYAKAKDWFPIIKYHNRWKDLSLIDFLEEKNYTYRDINKGFKVSFKVDASMKKDYKKETSESKDIPELNLIYMDKILELARKNNTEVILLSTPSTKNWNYKKHNKMVEYAKEKKLEFIDLNLVQEVDIDWDLETQDKGDHLNYFGAMKVTNYVAKYLSDKTYLIDHRNDSYYEEWNEDLIQYKEEVMQYLNSL